MRERGLRLLAVSAFATSLLITACGGGEEDAEQTTDDSDAAVAGQVATLAGAVAVRSGLEQALGDLAIAKTSSQVKRITEDAETLVAEAEQLQADRGEAPAGRALAVASRSARAATADLQSLSRALASAYKEAEQEREPSSEAQADLTAISKDVGELEADLGDLRRVLGILDQSIANGQGTLGEELETATGKGDRVVSKLASELRRRSAALQRTADELEPADVITDCTSEFNTVHDFSTRNMSCEEAQALLSDAIGQLAPSFTVGDFSCTILGDYGGSPGPGGEELILGAEDIRCEAGDRSFRFGFAD